MLVGIINKEDENAFTETVSEYATAINFSGIGYGTARSHYMSYFGFDEIEKRITMSLIPADQERKILSAVGHRLKLYLMGRGIAFTMTLSGISNIIGNGILAGSERQSERSTDKKMPTKGKEKDFMHELVIAVVNRNYTDEMLDAARTAGATGATVFHTKSINNSKAEQQIGTNIDTETDSVFFLTSYEYKTKIMEAIRDSVGLKTDGGAIIFSMPVDELVGIGRFNDYIEGEEYIGK